ncbi:MAG TPA: hypothetical protein VGK02_05010 [Candidatus Aquicultor sp.]|jgi:hypothetical protein
MKKLTILFAILTLVVLFSFTNALATTQGSLAVSPGKTNPGGTVTVTGGGFKPNTAVGVSMDGSGGKSVTANADGNISFTYTLPNDTRPGIHSFSAQGTAYSNTGTVVEPYSHNNTEDNHVALGSVRVETAVLGEQVTPTISTTVLGTKTTPKPHHNELPFTGGIYLLVALIAGVFLVATSFGLRLVRRS